MSSRCLSSSTFPSTIPLFAPMIPHASAFSVVQPSLLLQQQLHPSSPLPQQILHYSWTTPAITITDSLDAPGKYCEITPTYAPLDLTTLSSTPLEKYLSINTLTASPGNIRRQSSSSDSSSHLTRTPRRKSLKGMDRSSAEFIEHRRQKNENARRSRDTKRWTQHAIDVRVKVLEEENAFLRQAIFTIDAELSGLKQLALQAAAQLPAASAALQ